MAIIVQEVKPQASGQALWVTVLAAFHCCRVCPDGPTEKQRWGGTCSPPVPLLSWWVVRGVSPPSAQPTSEGRVAAMPSMWDGHQTQQDGLASLPAPHSQVCPRVSEDPTQKAGVGPHFLPVSFIPHHPLRTCRCRGGGPRREREVATPKRLAGKDTGPGRHREAPVWVPTGRVWGKEGRVRGFQHRLPALKAEAVQSRGQPSGTVVLPG